MINYEDLLDEAHKNDIYVIERCEFESNSKGLINGDIIGLSNRLSTTKERVCVLAEELAHYYMNVGNIINLNDTSNAQQEYKARLLSYNRLIGLDNIIAAYKAGCTNLSETAEFLGITEEFLAEAIEVYTNRYSPYIKYNDYIIYFSPFLDVKKGKGK